MRKLITLLLIITIFGFVGCSETQEINEETTSDNTGNDITSDEINTEDDTPEENSVEEENTPDISELVDEPDVDYYSCDNNQFPFRSTENLGGHGQFILTGELFIVEDQKPFFENETMDFVRMKVSNFDSEVAEKYFTEMAGRGNTINTLEDGALIFAVGTYENEDLNSTAEISDELKNEILKATDSGEELSLKVTIPFFVGRGAPPNFTFACKFE